MTQNKRFTQEDLLNAMGLKIGDKIRITTSQRVAQISLSKAYSIYYRYDDGSMYDIEHLIDIEYTVIPKPKYTLTETEKHIVLAIDEKWKWIARDEHKSLLCVFDDKPKIKGDGIWKPFKDYTSLLAINHHFQFIQWSDEEPVSLDELREIAKK